MQERKTPEIKNIHTLEDFIQTNAAFLTLSHISEQHYAQVFAMVKRFYFDMEKYSPVILFQLATGEVSWFNHHADKIQEYGWYLLFSAGFSGKIESLEWLVEKNLLQLSTEPIQASLPARDLYTDKDIVFLSIIATKNITALQWAAQKNLMRHHFKIALLLIKEGWKEGFVWFANTYPELLFKKTNIPLWYAQKIWAIFQNETVLINQVQSEITFQLLTGDLEFYQAYIDKIDEYGEEMIRCGIRSENIAVLDWLEEKQLIVPPCFMNKSITYCQKNEDILYKKIFPAISNYQGGFQHIFENIVGMSKNVKLLEWMHERYLIRNKMHLLECVINADWTEGFAWINDIFPDILNKNIEPSSDFFSSRTEQLRAMYLVVQYQSFSILEWCLQNKPFLLHQRGSYGRTLLHSATLSGNIKISQWFFEKFPILFDCNDNNNQETVMHLAALACNFQMINTGLSYNKKMREYEDRMGANMAVYALNSLNPQWFNKVLLLTKNPAQLNNIYSICSEKYINILKVLNEALDSNWLLKSISFQNHYSYEQPGYLMHEIENKLERNRKLILLFFYYQHSSFNSLPREIFNLIFQVNIALYKPVKNEGFFLKKKVDDVDEELNISSRFE